MLKQLVMDWYNHHANNYRRELKVVSMGQKDAVTAHKITDTDICFMLASLHAMRKEVNQHWWFTCSIE